VNEAAQINYAATGTINMGGHAATTAMVYASNAAVSLGGTAGSTPSSLF
jgi:hypothetical protein